MAGLLAAVGDARGEGLSLYLEPGFTATTLETRDQLGRTTTQEFRSINQNYRVNFDRPLGPSLAMTLGALFEDRQTEANGGSGWTSLDSTARGLYARLNLNLPALAGGLSYDLGDVTATRSARLVSENVAAFANWLPLDLPEVSLRVLRSHNYDATAGTQDVTTTGALLNARYQVRSVELKYALQWSRPYDAVSGTETSSINQAAQLSYSDRLFAERTALYASIGVRNQTSRTLQVGTGTISLQQFPIAGLSLLEVFPATPTDSTLALNPALVDGNLTTSAALDIGFSPTLAGDTNRRALGAQFGDLLTSVNTVRVWVDRKLTPEVAAAYAWSAYQSDDNKTWSPVPITGPVVYGPFEDRFEIPIRETRARYLKVLTQPLPPGVTTNQAFSSVLVTELQVFMVTVASAAPLDLASSAAKLDVTATTLLWRRANLSWDLTGTLERRLSPDVTLWMLRNGLSASQWLARNLQLIERLSRQDSDYGTGHLGQTDWSAGLLWKPLLTFTGSLIYSGQYVDSTPVLDPVSGRYVTGPGALTNTLTTLARADLYEGISAQLNASGSIQDQPDGKRTWSGTANATTTLSPNPWSSLMLGWYSTSSAVFAPDGSRTDSSSQRLDASLSLRPTTALSGVGTVTWILSGPNPTTTSSFQVNYAPFRGELQLSAGYSKTYDTASQSMLERFYPSLRWNVRQGVQITATYTLLNTTVPASESQSRSLSVVLNVNL